MTLLLLLIVYAATLAIGLARHGLTSVTKISVVPTGKPLKRILIIGATGGTGRQLLVRALEQGYVVSALVRDPGKLSVEDPHLTVVHGDVLDYSAVEKAVRGQDAVISALGHKRFFVLTRILSDGTRNVLRAMETHGVRRFVCETSCPGSGRDVMHLQNYGKLASPLLSCVLALSIGAAPGTNAGAASQSVAEERSARVASRPVAREARANVYEAKLETVLEGTVVSYTENVDSAPDKRVVACHRRRCKSGWSSAPQTHRR